MAAMAASSSAENIGVKARKNHGGKRKHGSISVKNKTKKRRHHRVKRQRASHQAAMAKWHNKEK